MQYPSIREELLTLLAADQGEVREYATLYRSAPYAADMWDLRERFLLRSRERAKRIQEILDEIGTPTIANVGADGSQAISVLALHAQLSDMKRVLRSFRESYQKDPYSVYHEAIPSLTDRVLIIQRKQQRFGTQWILGSDGKFFLAPVRDFAHMNERRAKYGLGISTYPVDLTHGSPEQQLPRLRTRKRDQRPLTEQQYQDFVYGSLD
jgi:hypothetical protein